MSTWYSKTLGDGVSAHEPSYLIKRAFVPAWVSAGCPITMAVFSRYDLRENIVTVYFTPEAEQLAKSFNATPCEKPSADRLGTLVGHPLAFEAHYPRSERVE